LYCSAKGFICLDLFYIVKVPFKFPSEVNSATRNMEFGKYRLYKRNLKEYCIQQQQENSQFLKKTSWKDKIERSKFLKVFMCFNDDKVLNTRKETFQPVAVQLVDIPASCPTVSKNSSQFPYSQ